LKERQHVELECSRSKCTNKLVYAQEKKREIKEEGRIIRKASRGARMLLLTMYKELQLYATNYKKEREKAEKKRLRLLVFE